jgi:hypothetical protein
MAVVNGTLQAVVNGPLMAMVNGTLMASVNGTLMAVVNGQVTFAVLVNGTLMAVVNGSLQPMVNGTLMAVVNGILQEVDSYTITNGTLQAVVNGQTYTLTNGSLQALVNGSLQAVVNNLGGISPTNNTNTAIVMDGNDLQVQGGALGGVFSVNMITGLNAGVQKLIPGAFFDPNVDVTYGMGEVVILPAPLTVDADWKYLNEGAPTPPQSFFTSTIKGLAYNDKPDLVTGITYSLLPAYTGTAGIHIIQPGSNTLYLPNYSPILFDTGRLYVNPFGSGAKKLIVKAECVRALTPAEVAQYGYQYMAFFTYNNRNASPVYIPRGADNFISIENGGQFSNTLPEVFEPGLHEVYILFSGHKMYWEVRSLESGHKTAVRSETNANSQKCQGGFTTSRQPAATEIETDKAIPLASVYPNPAHDRVRLSSPEKMVWEPVKQVNENTVEMTVSGLAPGIYHVQVKTAQGFRTLRFTKL